MIEPILAPEIADRSNWTLPRLQDAIERRTGERIAKSRLSVVLQKGASPGGGPGTRCPSTSSGGRQNADAVDRSGLRLRLLKQQAEAGDLTLLFGDAAAALTHPYLTHPYLTHPYLAHVWAKRGEDLRVAAPGRSHKRAMLGVLDVAAHRLLVNTSTTKRSGDFIALLGRRDALDGPCPGRPQKPVILVLDNGPIHTSTASQEALAARP